MKMMMNKKYLKTMPFIIGVLCIALSLGSCKEKGLIVDLGTGPVPSDTSYMGVVESPQTRRVLIEEFTGVSCPPCPLGHQIVASLVASNPDRISVISIQPFGFIQAYPVVERGDTLTRHDNRTDAGTTLSTGIFGKLSLTPSAGIDRISINSSMYLDKFKWVTAVNNRLTEPTKTNVTVTSDYNAVTRQAVIRVKVAYTDSVPQKQVLTVAITEDDIIDAQEYGTDKIDTFYNHEHVLRDILTTPVGSTILGNYAVKPAGIVYERVFVYDLSSKELWNKDHCTVIAYVSNSEPGDKVVQQAAQTSLK